MDDFKTHMPIVQTLGNPGMKARHWEKISDIVGFPIVVDEELSLEKVKDYTKHCLEVFVEHSHLGMQRVIRVNLGLFLNGNSTSLSLPRYK